MDAWDPSLFAAVAAQLAAPEAPRGSALFAFLQLYHSFAITSRFLREKPVAECLTALAEFADAHKDVPAPVRRTLAIHAPPNETLACAVTVASALFVGEILHACVKGAAQSARDTQAQMLARAPALAAFRAPDLAAAHAARERHAKELLDNPGAPQPPFAPISPEAIDAMRRGDETK